MQWLLEDLNEEQRRAVTAGEGPILVIAGAGSGKTRVLTRRIAWLIANGCSESEILGVTFTNKAAREMADRVERILPGTRIKLSTFHSACARFLRQSGERLGFGRDFTIYDTQDRDQVIKAIERELDISTKDHKPSAIGHAISALKNQGITPESFEEDMFSPRQQVIRRVYGPYQEALLAMNAMDFDDLLMHFEKLLREHEDLREYYAARHRYLLVDEFQDTNQIQYRIVRLLTSLHHNLCVVGDPDQSIYSFRGATVDNIIGFPEDYPDAQIIKLETNYRSSATILSLAQRVIACNVFRHEKELRPSLGEGDPVRYLVAGTGREEARLVAREVQGLVDSGIDPEEIAVFYRARFFSRGLEQAFRETNLPFTIVGDLGFFERKEIKDLIAFLQAIVNPFDKISLQRVLNVPPRGIGRVSSERFFAEAERQGLAPVEFLRRQLQVPGVKGRAVKGLAAVGRLFEETWELSLRSVHDTLEHVLEATGYVQLICQTGSFEDQSREENIRELLLDARNFDSELAAGVFGSAGEQGELPPAVATWLSRVSLLTDASDEEPQRGVQLMTVHAAKGLEFDHVYIVGLEEGNFPHSRSIDDPDGLEEERRLFYVAVTRARRTLTCVRSDLREFYEGGGGFRSQDPSRFLVEAGLIERKRTGDRQSEYDPGPSHELGEDNAYEEAVDEDGAAGEAEIG